MLVLAKLFCFACVIGLASCGNCNFPPSLWCSSSKIAQQCQVERQCASYMDTRAAVPVNFTVYLESLCPDCRNFIERQLWPTWREVNSIMNLYLVPYGNAQEHWDPTTHKWIFTCQHGTDECAGNMIETCAIDILQRADLFFPFVHCIEVSEDLPQISAPECAQKLNISYGHIKNCSQSGRGNQLEHQMAVKTANLKPPHQFVPWVTMNGEHTDEIQHKAQEDLLDLICQTYQGKKPKACLKTSKQRNCLRT